jgi:hypothetical protein
MRVLVYLGVSGLMLLPCLACVLLWLTRETPEAVRDRIPLGEDEAAVIAAVGRPLTCVLEPSVNVPYRHKPCWYEGNACLFVDFRRRRPGGPGGCLALQPDAAEVDQRLVALVRQDQPADR